MRSFALLSALFVAGASCQVTGALGDAAAITDNPEGAYYEAVLPNSEKNTVRGSVVATTNPGGKGVLFQVGFSGLPAEGGPFAYHLHSTPVPANGNCSGTLAHLDPYQRGQPPAAAKCDSANPQTCEVGDLSGKHGAITETTFQASYVDNYASLKEGIGAFFGNRSIVIHYANSTRITCANFTQIGAGSASSAPVPVPTAEAPYGYGNASATVNPTGTLHTSGVATPTGTPPVQQTVNAASSIGFGTGAIIAALAAFAL